MESLLARLPSRARIAVIRLRSLGDCVLTTPALVLLKAHRPDLRIRMVVEPRFAGAYSKGILTLKRFRPKWAGAWTWF